MFCVCFISLITGKYYNFYNNRLLLVCGSVFHFPSHTAVLCVVQAGGCCRVAVAYTAKYNGCLSVKLTYVESVLEASNRWIVGRFTSVKEML